MEIDLLDPGPFGRNDFWPTFTWLRAHSPVHWHPEPGSDDGGFWVLSRHRDIMKVYADSDTFSSARGMRLGSDPAAVAAVAQRMLIVSDVPHHTRLKRALHQAFGPQQMPRLEAMVEKVVGELVTEAVEQDELDFIDLAKQLPNRVVCAMMGIPRADWAWIGALTTDAFDSPDDEVRTNAHSEIFLYFIELLAERRARPGDDLVSQIAHDTLVDEGDGVERPLSDHEIVFNLNGVLSGANETTRYSAAGAVHMFAEHPDQWRLLRGLGQGGIAPAVEEILRWTTPGCTPCGPPSATPRSTGSRWPRVPGSRCGTSRPTVTRTSSPTRTPSGSTAAPTGTSPSDMAATCASARAWPASSSAPCSPRCSACWTASKSPDPSPSTPPTSPGGSTVSPCGCCAAEPSRSKKGPAL